MHQGKLAMAGQLEQCAAMDKSLHAALRLTVEMCDTNRTLSCCRTLTQTANALQVLSGRKVRATSVVSRYLYHQLKWQTV